MGHWLEGSWSTGLLVACVGVTTIDPGNRLRDQACYPRALGSPGREAHLGDVSRPSGRPTRCHWPPSLMASHLTHPVVVTPPLRLPPPAQPHSYGSWGLTGRSGPGQELARWEIRTPLGHLPWQGPSQWAPPPAPQGPHSHHSVMTACPVWLARDRLPMVCNLCRYTKRWELSLPPFHR